MRLATTSQKYDPFNHFVGANKMVRPRKGDRCPKKVDNKGRALSWPFILISVETHRLPGSTSISTLELRLHPASSQFEQSELFTSCESLGANYGFEKH